MDIHIKRIYDPPARSDGCRVLVDRIWPRGVSKADAKLDEWLKEIAPSSELRKWFGHDPERFAEFRRRYRAELKRNTESVEQIQTLARKHKRLTLLYGARDNTHNQAVVLAEYLQKK